MALRMPSVGDLVRLSFPDACFSLQLLGVSLRPVNGKGPAAQRIKYLSCWAKNWVISSHRAVCAKGSHRAKLGP